MNVYQGEDIAVEFKLFKDKEKTQPTLYADFEDMIIYAYTDGCVKAKFSKKFKVKYDKINDNGGNSFSITIDSDTSKLMAAGTIMLEVNAITPNSTVNNSRWSTIAIISVCKLLKSTIKYES